MGVGSTEPTKSAGAGFAGTGAGAADPQLERKNMLFGWALFALMLALAVGTVLVALIYLALD
jgi:hypothetical protein